MRNEAMDQETLTALIEVKITPSRDRGYDRVAERISRFEEVQSAYLMSGGFDLAIMIEGRSLRDIALFVSEKLSPLDSVLSTATHFVLKKYKEHGALVGDEGGGDERMILS
jgi:DNA-binding Lrp family transcriptional regulator